MTSLYKPLCDVLRSIPSSHNNRGKIACLFHDVLENAERENDSNISKRVVDVNIILNKYLPEKEVRNAVLEVWNKKYSLC